MESKRSFDSWQDIEFQNSRRVAKNIPMCTCEIDIAASACPQLPPGSEAARSVIVKPYSNISLKRGFWWDWAMTRPSDITRDRILRAAQRLFADRGYADTSVRAVVAKARVNQASINYH